MSDPAASQREVTGLRDEVSNLRGDIKELTLAFRELVRLESNMQRIDEATGRIGNESRDQEVRLRALEIAVGVNSSKMTSSEKLRLVIVAAISSGIVGSLVFVVRNS